MYYRNALFRTEVKAVIEPSLSRHGYRLRILVNRLDSGKEVGIDHHFHPRDLDTKGFVEMALGRVTHQLLAELKEWEKAQEVLTTKEIEAQIAEAFRR